jgi:signal transduction histidine kinase
VSAVLLVDDSPADRALFRTILSRDGMTVHEVATGRDALAKARELKPHVIVLDVNLPDADGHTVCRRLRDDPECAGVPVLMLTVRGNEADVLAGLEAGADDYVAKDAAREVVLARVRRLVRYRQMATTSVLNEQLAQVGRLLAGIVHEIRGPLSVIRGNAELLRLHFKPGDEELEQWVEPIVRSAQLLQARLEHLMAAVRTGPPNLQPCEIVPLVKEATDLFHKGTDPRSGKVVIETHAHAPLPHVKADGGRLIQVILNLLANAREAILSVKEEGRIVVDIDKISELGQTWVRLAVRDDGPGIPPALLGRLFEPFFTTKETGSGYGLYLAHEIVCDHGGQLTAGNQNEGGAVFTIRLPSTDGEPAEPAHVPSEASHPAAS